ncbi:MAG: polyprenyl synthetase family protein [Clostridiales bacterium]|nr:polyprenyl synthetase family protein [Clostridiales bacterium]
MKTYEEYRQIAERALGPMLESLGEIPEKLLEAMKYSLEAGGKRLRPVMLLAACDMAGGDTETALPFACAIEMIHTYSLIHDDLPAMDNDDLRRGKPTNHKVFGENLAILAGDGLLNAAAELMARTALRMADQRGIRAMEIIMRHAGVTGMIAGQTRDVLSEGETPREDLVAYIHSHKTADLLEAPMEAGLALAGADEAQIRAGHEYGLHLGMAFQMTDDLLDVKGDAALMGKNTGMDSALNKMTWVALRGTEGTEKDAEEQAEQAVRALESLPWEHGFFERLIRSIVTRNH